MKMGWIKNSDGKQDAMLTFATVSFFSCLTAIMLPMFNGIQIPWTHFSLSVSAPSETLILGFLAATFTSYVVRRNKKDQIGSEEVRENIKNGIMR